MFARLFLLVLLLPVPALGESLRIAVASNFHATLEQLAADFSAAQGITVELIPGASGTLYAQASRGAPFDLFFSADTERPRRLVAQGLAPADSLTVYAIGQLVLWQPRGKAPLADGSGVIAVAQPRLAPYGTAALAWLRRRPDAGQLLDRLVYGNNVAQAFHFVASGNADTGLVALAQVLSLPQAARGHFQTLPAQPDAPLAQAAVILSQSLRESLARAFLDHVRSQNAAILLRERGYGVPGSDNAGAQHAGQ